MPKTSTPKSKPISIRLSPGALQQLVELGAYFGENTSTLITRTIAYMHTEHREMIDLSKTAEEPKP